MHIKTQIITLKSTPFKDHSKIIQALTGDLGIISIIVNKINNKNLNHVRISTPFTISEITLKKRNSDIYSIEDFLILDENLHLRKDLVFLNLASHMTKAILDSQFFQKKASKIYLLIKTYIKKISINPLAIYLSFLLKLLNMEGLLNLQTNCSVCKKTSQSLSSGDSVCINHANEYSFNFSEDDFKKLFILCYAKSFSMFKDLEITKELKDKISLLFNDLI